MSGLASIIIIIIVIIIIIMIHISRYLNLVLLEQTELRNK